MFACYDFFTNSENVYDFQKISLYWKFVRKFHKCSCSWNFVCKFKICLQIWKNIHIFYFGLHIQKHRLGISENVHAFSNCSHFQNKSWFFFHSFSLYKICSESKMLYPFSNFVHQFKKNIHVFKACSRILKNIHIFRNILKFLKMFMF